MTQQEDARRALALVEQDTSIPETIRTRLRNFLNDPGDPTVKGLLDDVRDDALPNNDRLGALRDLVTIAKNGSLGLSP